MTTKIKTLDTTLKIELFDPAKLLPSEKNNKKHPDDEISRLAAVIESQGFDQPIVVDKDLEIIKGHGRRLAALKLGLKFVPVIVRNDLTKEQADAARISDNLTFGQKYDTKKLQDEINRLLVDNDFGLDADSMGLSQKEKDIFMADLDIANLDALMEDTHAEVEAQKKEDIRLAEETDKAQIKTHRAFGFNSVDVADCRVITRFQVYAESLTGMTGKEAFIKAIQTVLD